MKISLNWLNEYVNVPDLPNNLQAFCDKLDLTGTGVENVLKLGDSYDKIVTGKILERIPHPDSDHMFVTKVDVGDENPLQIVCGAQNFKEGDHVVVALVGAVLQEKFKIKKSKLRGVMSYGMNCSEEELGLADKSEGIMILPDDAPIGVPIADYLGLSDVVIDTEITPNRPDCLSVVGCAREISTIYNVPFANPLKEAATAINNYKVYNISDGSIKNVVNMPNVMISDNTRCSRYTARVITGVKVGPSPKWLVERLNSMGARSINNIVDITNYILYLYGQPLHAFDYDKLADNGKTNIIVRPANTHEHFTTLDNEERVLNPDITVISTEKSAVALAGVMGGLDSEVTDNTTTILLETATFSPAHTSRTSRSLSLISESSMRYERRVDDSNIIEISNASAALIMEVAGGVLCSSNGKLDGSIVDVWPIRTQPNSLKFRTKRFQSMMGEKIPVEFIKNTLIKLGCNVAEENDVLNVMTPTFRPDLEREIDLFEEVLRIYGMDRIPSSLPKSSKRVGKRTFAQLQMDKIHNVLCGCGLHETLSYSFANEADVQMLGNTNEIIGLGKSVKLINPMNAEQKAMRQSILPGLLRSISYNLNHGVNNISLYEIGTVFTARTNQQKPKEKQKVCCVLAGNSFNIQWNNKPVSYDFFDAKGIIENLCSALNIKKLRFKPLNEIQAPHLQPGRAASVHSGGSILGWVGQIHPFLQEKLDIDVPVAAFELDIKGLINSSNEIGDYIDIPVYPGISVDVAFVVDDKITHEMMMQRISSAGGKLLCNVRLFDLFIDENKIGPGKKSLTYNLEYRNPNKTLKREDIEKIHQRLIKKVCGSTGAEVRS